MALSAEQRRRAATLLNAMDMLWRTTLPGLGEPFRMTLAEIGRYREWLFMTADSLRKVHEVAETVLVNPADLLGWLAPDADALDYAAYEYPVEEERATIEAAEMKAREEAERIERAEEILRKKGLITAKPAKTEEETDRAGEGEGEMEQEVRQAGEAEPTESFPTLEERIAAYRAAHSSLIASLKKSCQTLTAWVQQGEAARFK